MGSSDESENKSTPRDPEFTNPLGLAFMNLFGVPVSFNPKNQSFGISGDIGQQGSSLFAHRMFGPDDFGLLRDQLGPVQDSPFANLALQNLPGADQAFGSAIDFLNQSVIPGLDRAGQVTDIAPIQAQQMRLFNQQIVPELANQFGFLGGGGQNLLSSDFGAAVAREGGNIATNLGALQFQAEEAAADRMLQAGQIGAGVATTLGGLGAQRAAFPTALGQDLLALQEQNLDFQLLNRPGGLLLNFLNNLMGVTQPDPLLLGNISRGSRDSFSIL